MKQMSFVAAVLDYFGRLPGQTVNDLQKELKALSLEDREYFIREFATVGYQITRTPQ